MDNTEKPKRGRPLKDQTLNDNETIEALKQQNETIEALKQKVEILTKATSKYRLAKYTPTSPLGRDVTIGIYEGKVIKRWDKTKDEVRYNKKEEFEDQVLKLVLEDKTTVEVNLGSFDQVIDKVKVSLDMEKTTFDETHVNVEYAPKKFRTQTYRAMKKCFFIYGEKEHFIDAEFVNP